MGRLSEKKREEVLSGYFEEGLEPQELAQRIGISQRTVCAVLGDEAMLEPYRKRGEAAKLRAQICVNESAEEAARMQAMLMRREDVSQSVTQRAAKDILDRAGIRVPKEDHMQITVTFAGGMPQLGMPKRSEESE